MWRLYLSLPSAILCQGEFVAWNGLCHEARNNPRRTFAVRDQSVILTTESTRVWKLLHCHDGLHMAREMTVGKERFYMVASVCFTLSSAIISLWLPFLHDAIRKCSNDRWKCVNVNVTFIYVAKPMREISLQQAANERRIRLLRIYGVLVCLPEWSCNVSRRPSKEVRSTRSQNASECVEDVRKW